MFIKVTYLVSRNSVKFWNLISNPPYEKEVLVSIGSNTIFAKKVLDTILTNTLFS